MVFRSLILITLMLTTLSARAIDCQVNLNYGVIIDPKHLRFTKNTRTVVQINHDNQLFVGGREISLTPEQQKVLTSYAKEIRYSIPQIVSLVSSGVEIRLQALDKIIGGLTGENSLSHQKIQETFADIQDRLNKRFNHSDDNYYIAPQDFNEFDQFFEGELAQQLEQVVSHSLGSIFTAFDKEPANNNNLEQRMVAFGRQLDIVSEDMEIVSLSNTNELEEKATEFCNTLNAINRLESNLVETIPDMTAFNLIQIGN